MAYTVKEIFYTLQGEGFHAGRPAVFCRFTGCNLWTGREEDRRHSVCSFCDTDFAGIDGPGGGRYASAPDLARALDSRWPRPAGRRERKFLVFTGGEPLLQADGPLAAAAQSLGFEVAVETNGTRPLPAEIDWITVSPKAGAELVLRSGSELKLVYPQPGAEPELFEDLDFEHFFLQPLDGPCRDENVGLAVQYCLDHPQWRLGLQLHKVLGIP